MHDSELASMSTKWARKRIFLLTWTPHKWQRCYLVHSNMKTPRWRKCRQESNSWGSLQLKLCLRWKSKPDEQEPKQPAVMPRRGDPRQATSSSLQKEKLRGQSQPASQPASLCNRYCKFPSSTLAYPWLWFTARLKWMVAGDSWTFTLPVLYAKDAVSIWQHAPSPLPLPPPRCWWLLWNHSS